MSILETTPKKNKHAFLKPTGGVLDFTTLFVLHAKQRIKPKRLKKLIKKIFNR
ncbi:MAG: hypothetical protein JW976_05055 [Syntrophaceae bacterium]|nr:hypothetical protein [Syntrophaceae bacterium]